jgi:hypothetical protein
MNENKSGKRNMKREITKSPLNRVMVGACLCFVAVVFETGSHYISQADLELTIFFGLPGVCHYVWLALVFHKQ